MGHLVHRRRAGLQLHCILVSHVVPLVLNVVVLDRNLNSQLLLKDRCAAVDTSVLCPTSGTRDEIMTGTTFSQTNYTATRIRRRSETHRN